jgi:MSHA biogenesis protein MshM
MIRSYFGIEKNPFSKEDLTLLKQQQDVYDILKVHCMQGGFCLLLGQPGTGKTVIKEALKNTADKRTVVITVARTLHTYTNTIKILCQAFNIPHEATHFKCEKNLIEEAYNLHRNDKMVVIIIDDAHLMEIDTLRKLRLMLEDFPKSHNLILVGQPSLLHNISLNVHQDIKSRITFSHIMPKLNPDDIKEFILNQLDKVGLAHNIFTPDAIDLITRSSDGILRKARNLSLSCMLEAARRGKKEIDLDNVNKILIQPHWRVEFEVDKLSI